MEAFVKGRMVAINGRMDRRENTGKEWISRPFHGRCGTSFRPAAAISLNFLAYFLRSKHPVHHQYGRVLKDGLTARRGSPSERKGAGDAGY